MRKEGTSGGGEGQEGGCKHCSDWNPVNEKNEQAISSALSALHLSRTAAASRPLETTPKAPRAHRPAGFLRNSEPLPYKAGCLTSPSTKRSIASKEIGTAGESSKKCTKFCAQNVVCRFDWSPAALFSSLCNLTSYGRQQ